MDIHVICGLDKHINNVSISIQTIRKVFSNDDVGVASFCNTDEDQPVLKNFAKENSLPFCLAHQDCFDPSKRNDIIFSSEIIGMMQISEYFYNLGYENVFLVHNDVVVLKNYKEKFNKYKKNNWAVVCPFINFLTKDISYVDDWGTLSNQNSQEIQKTSFRLTQNVVLFNPKFIKEVSTHFWEWGQYFNLYWRDSSVFGDCALFDLKNHFGYTISPILEEITAEPGWIPYNILSAYCHENGICFVHFSSRFQNLMAEFK